MSDNVDSQVTVSDNVGSQVTVSDNVDSQVSDTFMLFCMNVPLFMT